MTFSLSKKTVLGVATESAPATVPSAPTHYVPTKHTYKRIVTQEYISDDRGVRDDNNDVVQLVFKGQNTLTGDFYADTSGYFIYAALGAEAATYPSQPDSVNAPTAYHHRLIPADTLPSLSLYKSYQAELYQLPYNIVTKFGLKFTNEGTLKFTTDTESNSHQTFSGTWAPSISTVHPMAGAVATIKYNGSSTTNIDNIEVDFEQEFTLWYSGSRDYITAYPGARKSKFKFDARFDSGMTGIYDDFCTTPQPQHALEFIITGVNMGTSGSPTYQTCDVLLPAINFDTGEHDTSKANVLVKMAGTALPSTGTLIQVDLINTIATYTS